MRIRTAVVILVVLAMLALSACGGAGSKTVKIAILAPLSGDVATFGQSTRDGAMLAIEVETPRRR